MVHTTHLMCYLHTHIDTHIPRLLLLFSINYLFSRFFPFAACSTHLFLQSCLTHTLTRKDEITTTSHLSTRLSRLSCFNTWQRAKCMGALLQQEKKARALVQHWPWKESVTYEMQWRAVSSNHVCVPCVRASKWESERVSRSYPLPQQRQQSSHGTRVRQTQSDSQKELLISVWHVTCDMEA